MPEGRESPPPETQGDAQKGAPSNASGVDQGIDTKAQSKKDLESLGSNPKGVLDDHAEAVVSKTFNPADRSDKK